MAQHFLPYLYKFVSLYFSLFPDASVMEGLQSSGFLNLEYCVALTLPVAYAFFRLVEQTRSLGP